MYISSPFIIDNSFVYIGDKTIWKKIMETGHVDLVYNQTVSCTFNQESAFNRELSLPKNKVFSVCGMIWNSHHLMKSKLYGIIFMSSVLQTLVHLSFKQILDMVLITWNHYKFVGESFNRDSLFFSITCAFGLHIQYLFVYLFKLLSTKPCVDQQSVRIICLRIWVPFEQNSYHLSIAKLNHVQLTDNLIFFPTSYRYLCHGIFICLSMCGYSFLWTEFKGETIGNV